MGPIALFDKSFVQSLSVDESVWFDKFFIPVVCPIFFVETLADLAKSPRSGRSPEAEVRIIASKFPEMSGSPCANHSDLCFHNLLGYDVVMDGRIPLPGGRHVMGGNRAGIVYDQSSEEAAFHRWQNEEFGDLERLFASQWRANLNAINLGEIADVLRSFGVDQKSCPSLADAKRIAHSVVIGSNKRFERLGSAVRFFQLPQDMYGPVVQRWRAMGEPALDVFAPYAAFVLTVEVFFHIALAAGLISSQRNSNRTDLGYLFYLPFCQIFISSDRLHQNTAHLFLREDQQFVWGIDLKADLKKINDYYLRIPEAEREIGVMKLARHPPIEGEYLVSAIWQKYMRSSPDHHRNLAGDIDPAASKRLAEELIAFTKGKTVSRDQFPSDDHHDTLSITRQIKRRKGSWWQIPKDLPIPPDG